MRFKKLFTALTTAVLVSAFFVMPVSAHGHHGHHEQRYTQTVENTDCPVCTVDGCTEAGRHTHDGHDYCGYNHESGYCDGSCEAAVSDTTDSEETVSKKSVSNYRCVRRHHCYY